MQDRSRSLGIGLEVVDTSQDVAHEVEALKRAIGQAAAHYVQEGDTIILDAGRTTAYLAHALRGKLGLTVITNSLAVLDELRDEPGITLVSCGGVVRREPTPWLARAPRPLCTTYGPTEPSWLSPASALALACPTPTSPRPPSNKPSCRPPAKLSCWPITARSASSRWSKSRRWSGSTG